MKTKFTRGPWEVRIHDKGIYFTEVEVWHQNYGRLAIMPDITSIWNSDKNEAVAKIQLELTIANATVMAAAPEMLNALIGTTQALELFADGQNVSSEIAEAKEVIKKATL